MLAGQCLFAELFNQQRDRRIGEIVVGEDVRTKYPKGVSIIICLQHSNSQKRLKLANKTGIKTTKKNPQKRKNLVQRGYSFECLTSKANSWR